MARHGVGRFALHAPAAGFGGVELYPEVFDKAAVLCARRRATIRSPTGTSSVAYLAPLEFLARNGIEWAPPSVDETVTTIEGVAAGTILERELADRLRATCT